MNVCKRYAVCLMAVGMVTLALHAADIVLENAELRLVLDEGGWAKSLVVKNTQSECLLPHVRLPFMTLTQYRPYDNENFLTYPAKPTVYPANRIVRKGNELIVEFDGTADVAHIGIKLAPNYLGLSLRALDFKIEHYGIKRKTETDEFALMRLPMRRRSHFGSWLNVTWDDASAVALIADSPECRVDAFAREDGGLEFYAGMENRVRLEGVGAILVATETARLLPTLATVERDYDMPNGAEQRMAVGDTASFYWTSCMTPRNVDRHIAACKAGGFHTLQIYYMAFANTCGHFNFRTDLYPNGLADLKAVTDRIRASGLEPGLHFHYNKVSTNDAYVTSGVPDSRLAARRQLLLARPLGAADTTIYLQCNPMGILVQPVKASEVASRESSRNLVQIGAELIRYNRAVFTPPYRLEGCQRGVLGSTPAAHTPEERFRHLDVDDWPLFIRIDQDTDLQDEMADALASIIRTCSFRAYHYDGAEDVPEPYWYNVPRAQTRLRRKIGDMQRWARSAAFANYSWHAISHGCGFDMFPHECVRAAVDRYWAKKAFELGESFTTTDFGSLDVRYPDEMRTYADGTKRPTTGMQPDHAEFTFSKSLAWRGCAGVRIYREKEFAHPRFADILAVMRRWEEIRRAKSLPTAILDEMKDPQREWFVWPFDFDPRKPEIIEYRSITCDEARPFRAFSYVRKGKAGIVYWSVNAPTTPQLALKDCQTQAFAEGGRRFIEAPVSEKRLVELFLNAVVRSGAAISCPAHAASARNALAIDFAQTCGPVKPVNGINQPPMVGMPMRAPMFHYLKDAGVSHSRLHDVGGSQGQNRYVDIPNVFRNFDADETNPTNYDFAATDILVKHLGEQGVEMTYQLGATIGNRWAWGRKIGSNERIVPLKDFAKWARICERVIRHYTEGWANGMKANIPYWEISNVPDNREDPSGSPLWQAPFEEYIRFYGVVAPYLKAKFPNLRIGGCGMCGFCDAVGASAVAAAHSSPPTRHCMDCVRKFLKAVRDNNWPLDFFSYHSYADAPDALRQVAFADSLLNDYGFTRAKTERVYGEWLPVVGHDSLGTARQAAQIAAELIGLQNGPCDLACIYDGRCGPGNYSSLFNPMTLKPHKAYYAFMMFGELRKLGKAVKLPNVLPSSGVYVTAATDGATNAAVMVANVSGNPWRTALAFGDWNVSETRVIDARHTYARATWPVEIPNDTTWLLKLTRRTPHARSAPPTAASRPWPGFSRGMGFGGWLTNYKRFNVLPEDRRLLITEGDLEHFDTYLAEADVARVASWGFDHVRVGFDQIVLEEKPGVWRERTFRALDAFVAWCEKHGLNVVLNLHKAIGNYCDIPEKTQLLDDAALQARFIALWLEIERRYHASPGLAFEILNEVRDVDPAKWNALADRTIRALRAVNPDRWIVVGSTSWNAPATLAKLKLWDDPKVVYTFHMYAPFEFTHQRGVLQRGPLAYNRELSYPAKDNARYRGFYEFYGRKPPFGDNEAIDRAFLKRALAGAGAFVKAHPDKILWNGEFGTIRHAPKASRVAYMRDVIAICREWGIPYCVWNYLSTPNDGNRFSLVDDDTREFLSDDLLRACLGD